MNTCTNLRRSLLILAMGCGATPGPEHSMPTGTTTEVEEVPAAREARRVEPPADFVVSAGICPNVIPSGEMVTEDLRLELSEDEQADLRATLRRWIFDPGAVQASSQGVMFAHGELDDGIGFETHTHGVSRYYCGQPAQELVEGMSNGLHTLLTSEGLGHESVAVGQSVLQIRCDGNVCCASSAMEYQVAQGVVFERRPDGWRVRAIYQASDDATLAREYISLGYEEIRQRLGGMTKHHGCGAPSSPRVCETAGVFCEGPVGQRQTE